MKYVGGDRAPGCVFCRAIEFPDNPDSLVVDTGTSAFMLLNRFPYNSGHLMVVPIEHVPSIEDLDAATRAEMMELVNLAIEAARLVFRCDGFNVGMNIGQVAGAGIADHLHMHLVPRWTGDANFMPILSDTMVIPETLEATHARLRAEIATRRAASDNQHEIAAGALVYVPERDAFVLRRTEDAPVVLPKGKVETGETAAEAAVREVREETGVDATIVGWLGQQVFSPPDANDAQTQHVVYFLATGSDTENMQHHLNTDTILATASDLESTIGPSGLRDLIARRMPSILSLAGAR